MSNRDLQDLVVRCGLATRDQISDAVNAASGTRVRWLERLLLLGVVDEESICRCLADAHHVRRCARDALTTLRAEVLALLPPELACEHRAVPVGLDDDGDLRLAMVDPGDVDAQCEIEFFTGRRIVREVALATDVAEALNHHYGAVTALSPRLRGVVTGPFALQSLRAGRVGDAA